MHELGLARNIAAIVGEHAGGRRVSVVRLAIGPLACVERSALEFCWQVVTEGTALGGAALDYLPAERDSFVIREFAYEEVEPCAALADAAMTAR